MAYIYTLACFAIIVVILGYRFKKINNVLDLYKDDSVKIHDYYDTVTQWLKLYQMGGKLADYFIVNNYKTVAVYGINGLGQLLIDELLLSKINDVFGIDKNAKKIETSIEIFSPDDELRKADVVVIASLHYYNDIEPMIRSKMKCEVVGIDDVIYEVMSTDANRGK